MLVLCFLPLTKTGRKELRFFRLLPMLWWLSFLVLQQLQWQSTFLHCPCRFGQASCHSHFTPLTFLLTCEKACMGPRSCMSVLCRSFKNVILYGCLCYIYTTHLFTENSFHHQGECQSRSSECPSGAGLSFSAYDTGFDFSLLQTFSSLEMDFSKTRTHFWTHSLIHFKFQFNPAIFISRFPSSLLGRAVYLYWFSN